MFSYFMWGLGMMLEAVVLVRGQRTNLVSRFPLFYSYLLVVLIQDVIRTIAYVWYSQAVFANVYWTTQFVSLVMGSIVIFEIYRLALQSFPGTAKMARIVLGSAFAGIFVRALLTMHVDTAEGVQQAYIRLERDLRLVQSVAIVIMVVSFLWYAIPLGRNLGAILAGYGTFVALSVIQLTIVKHFEYRAQHFWNIVQPLTYTCIVGLWVWKLWSPDRVVEKSCDKRPKGDYEKLARATSRSLEEARRRLGSVVRS